MPAQKGRKPKYIGGSEIFSTKVPKGTKKEAFKVVEDYFEPLETAEHKASKSKPNKRKKP